MFLLIPNAARYASQLGYAFTFQYVSINTSFWKIRFLVTSTFTFQYVSINTLIVRIIILLYSIFTFQYVSINTRSIKYGAGSAKTFTFQYVSINTFQCCWSTKKQRPLHSNMFLLIPRSSEPPINSSILYHILSTMVFFYLFIYFDITRFTGSTILLMFFTFVDLS